MLLYYEYKKERLEKKFYVVKDIFFFLRGVMKEFNNINFIFLKRLILGYFEDLMEYLIDMFEMYLVMIDNYVDGCFVMELIKRVWIYDFFDDILNEFLLKIVRFRNRYIYDYYKRDGVEEEIFKCCFFEIMYMEIFLEVSDIEIYLKSRGIEVKR